MTKCHTRLPPAYQTALYQLAADCMLSILGNQNVNPNDVQIPDLAVRQAFELLHILHATYESSDPAYSGQTDH
jgi:hypothetical protein